MKSIFSILSLSLLISTGTVYAQDNVSGNARNGRSGLHSDNNPTGINLSIWKNVSTQRTDTIGSTCLNLGIFSSMNRLNGLGINLIGSVVGRDVNGLQVSGLANMAGGSMHGMQVAGICNINGNHLAGLSISGLVGITGHNTRGITFAGLANINGNYSHGIVLGGLLNISGEDAVGIHFAGLANISGGSFRGMASSGLLSIVGSSLQGAQVAGLACITAENMTGIQIAGLSNVTGSMVQGVQLSPVNIAERVKGVQIGLINYYKRQLDGFQLGLVNANPDTKIQLMLFGGNATKLNVGFRFKNRLFYTILGGGTHYLDFNDKFSASFFYRAGLALPLYQRLSISGDLGYQHIETFKNKNYGIPSRLYALQARINLEYFLNDHLGVFLTGGYGGSRYYTRSITYDKGIIAECGIIVPLS